MKIETFMSKPIKIVDDYSTKNVQYSIEKVISKSDFVKLTLLETNIDDDPSIWFNGTIFFNQDLVDVVEFLLNKVGKVVEFELVDTIKVEEV